MKSDKDKNERPLAYPKPTETDVQLKNQDEYTERQSARNSEDLPAHGGTGHDSVREGSTDGRNTQSGEQMP
jgi:hypothetical protein